MSTIFQAVIPHPSLQRSSPQRYRRDIEFRMSLLKPESGPVISQIRSIEWSPLIRPARSSLPRDCSSSEVMRIGSCANRTVPPRQTSGRCRSVSCAVRGKGHPVRSPSRRCGRCHTPTLRCCHGQAAWAASGRVRQSCARLISAYSSFPDLLPAHRESRLFPNRRKKQASQVIVLQGFMMCGKQDLNLHPLARTRPST